MTLTASRFYNSRTPVSAAQEAAMFGRLKMRNGTFKLTRPSRFKEWEELLLPFVAHRAAGITEVLDIGASTGLTTVELSDFLYSSGVTARTVATDLFIDAFIVEAGFGLRVLCDREGWPLQYDLGGVALRPWTRRLDYLTLLFAPLALLRRMLQPRLEAAVRAGNARHVQMTTKLLSSDKQIQFIENDIMVRTPSFARRFDFVRAANILNRGYFSPAQLRTALVNVRSYLRGSGSRLLVTRTGETHGNRGTLFELREDGRFRTLVRLREGSEIEDLVLSLVPESMPTSRDGVTVLAAAS